MSIDVPTRPQGGRPERPKRRRPISYLRSGLYARPELPGLDTAIGQLLAERRSSLIADLGVEPSTAQLALIELALRTWCLDACDAFLLSLPLVTDPQEKSPARSRS